MNLLPQKLNKSGQHALEYLLLISLVIAGIIIMQPYVIRGWNAYIKSEETSIKDSYDDPLTSTLLDINPNCACGYLLPCDTPPCCGYGGCARTTAARVWTCNPLNCQAGADQCNPDPLCCDDPVFLSPLQCGSAGGCPAGEARGTQQCGSGTVNKCFYNPLCVYQCQGVLAEGNKILSCGGSYYTGLTNNTTYYNYVTNCTGTKCQVQCKAPFVPASGGTTCACPDNTVEINCTNCAAWRAICPSCICPTCCPPCSCGDNNCIPSQGETCETCPGDCGSCFCGNGNCEAGENCANCESDCGGCTDVCGDGACRGLETCASCLADCGTCICGDSICSGSENFQSCPTDCPSQCGDGLCITPTENCIVCTEDCPACSCGDGICTSGENSTNCPADCP